MKRKRSQRTKASAPPVRKVPAGSARTAADAGDEHAYLTVVRGLYEGQSQRAVRFRYGLLAFDLSTIGYIVLSSFMPRTVFTEIVDNFFGLIILADFIARLLISRNRVRHLMNPVTWADLIAIISFIAPFSSQAAAFLRVLRTLRLLHTYRLLSRLRRDSQFFRHHEEVLLSVAHLSIFIFVMTAIVYEAQHATNPEIRNYVDALYFTVSSLTTTGYGDIVLSGSLGRFLSVVIMIFGVTLFLRLARAVLQPSKVRFPCPVCGLQRHEHDAVHCKACGTLLNIPDEGHV
jgi:voltage-gated potassium channel